MGFLHSPKVRLGLIVNGLYFLSLATPQPHGRPREYVPHSSRQQGFVSAAREPVYAPLPPPSGPSKATTYYTKGTDQMDVSLTKDLTLVRRRGHTLLLSPTLTTRGRSPEPPRSILLRFVSFSEQQTFFPESPLVITADGVEMWNYGRRLSFPEVPGSSRPLHSVAFDDKGDVIETLGHELPYEVFIEVISAKRVIFSLGPDRVELTANQIEALRDMHRRLPQPPPPPEEKRVRD